MSNLRLKVRNFQNKIIALPVSFLVNSRSPGNETDKTYLCSLPKIWTKNFKKLCLKFWQFENPPHHRRSLLYLYSCWELWHPFLERISCFHSQFAASCGRVWGWFVPKLFTFQGLHFLFSGSLSWSIYIWAICPWNKFDGKAHCEPVLEHISSFHSQCVACCSETSTFYIHLGMCVCCAFLLLMCLGRE